MSTIYDKFKTVFNIKSNCECDISHYMENDYICKEHEYYYFSEPWYDSLQSKQYSNNYKDCNWKESYNTTSQTEITRNFIDKFFDNIISQVNPNITFLLYKELYNKCITIESYSISDYYTRGEGERICVNIKKLVDLLLEYKFLNIEGYYIEMT